MPEREQDQFLSGISFQTPIYHTLVSSTIGSIVLLVIRCQAAQLKITRNSIPKTHWAAKLARIMAAVTTHIHTHTHTQIGISLGEGDSWSCQKSFQLRRVAVLPFSWGVDRLPNAQSGSGNQRRWGRGWATTGNRFIEFSFRFTQGDCCFDNAPRKALREELCRMRYLLLLCSQLSLDWSPSPN